MNETLSFSSLCFYYAVNILLIVLAKKVEGFSIELIHPLSPKSPIYKNNTTYSETIIMFTPQSTSNLSHTSISSSAALQNSILSHVLEHTMQNYLIKVNLGTFPDQEPSSKTYYLEFDTGSDIIWLQCEDCTKIGGHCFEQSGPPYPNHMSTSYVPLPCGKHELCFPNECLDQNCSYDLYYGDGAASFGILAHETFSFDVSHMDQPKTARIVIGCGINNLRDTFGVHSKKAGIFGMSWSPHSFVNQIASHSQGRFSYCLPPLLGNEDDQERPFTILHFGSETHAIQGLQSLPIQHYMDDYSYYDNLEGISINNMRLNIPSHYFAKTGRGYGGCVLDTGTTYTLIPRPAFKILKKEMMRYIASMDTSLIKRRGRYGFNLCYMRRPPFKWYENLPSVTFHFEGGANLVLKGEIVFIVWRRKNKEHVCLSILPGDKLVGGTTIIGAQSQSNHVFVYDLPSKMVYIGPRDCALHP